MNRTPAQRLAYARLCGPRAVADVKNELRAERAKAAERSARVMAEYRARVAAGEVK